MKLDNPYDTSWSETYTMVLELANYRTIHEIFVGLNPDNPDDVKGALEHVKYIFAFDDDEIKRWYIVPTYGSLSEYRRSYNENYREITGCETGGMI